MSFSVKGFKTLDYLGTAAGSPGTRKCWHTYVSNDDVATIETANYFDDIIAQLHHADALTVVGDVDGTPFKRDYVIDLTTSADHVLIAREGTAAGKGLNTLAFYVDLANIAAGDVLTNYVPGYSFKIEAFDFRVNKAATTAAKAATLNLEINTTDLTGGAIALTSANCTPAGAAVAGSAITAGNTGGPTDSFSIEASSVTTFSEGSGWMLVRIRNLDE